MARPSARPPITPTARPTAIWSTKSSAIATARAVVGGDVEQADHERDPDRVVHAGLALEDVVAAAAHLAAAEHREHHRRVGGRERRPDQERCRPAGDRRARGRAPPAGPPPGRCRPPPGRRSATATPRNRAIPMSWPPSNRITISATRQIRSTSWIVSSGARFGIRSDDTVAAARNSAGRGHAQTPADAAGQDGDREADRDDQHHAAELGGVGHESILVGAALDSVP